MELLDLDEAAEYLNIKRSFLQKIIKNGRELKLAKKGRKNAVEKADIDAWLEMKRQRTVLLNKGDFIKAFKFGLEINYGGHTRADFGTSRQRSITQAVENWTQGALAEIALSKFIEEKFNAKLQLEFRIFKDAIVGQDIVAVTRSRVSNPPKKGVSVKSGKENGMVLIVPTNEIEKEDRASDFYVFVRVIYPTDFILRLLRYHPDLSDLKEKIPEIQDFRAEIVGYCMKDELEKRAVPEAGIKQERYVKPSGELKNRDADWKAFADAL